MDGVITTEEKYWACVRLTLWELVTKTLNLPDAFGDAVHDEAIRIAIVPDELIYALKGRAVNSNWDIAYMLVCIYLSALPDATVFSAMDISDFLDATRDTTSGPADAPHPVSIFLATTHSAQPGYLLT